MIINKVGLKKFIFSIILFLITNNCHIRQNSEVKVEDYYIDEKSNDEIDEEKQQYEQRIFSKDFKSLTFKSNSLFLGDPCYNLKSLNAVSIDFDLLKNIRCTNFGLHFKGWRVL